MVLKQDYIGKTLLRGMVRSLQEKGAISIHDIADIFLEVADSVNAGDPRIDEFVRTEISKMALYIAEAKKEILAIVPQEQDEKFFNAAGDELSAVVEATENATNTILDSTDTIITTARKVDNELIRQRLFQHANIIYDACSFQDITGQRVNKVLKTLEQVETKIARLAVLFGTNNELVASTALTSEDALRDKRADAHLMEGPQLKGHGVSQADIDALFG
ncbi:MAG: hypothetical protein EAZ74_05730 [Alphaproteobacteria bacterium]|nr:MAG: hypothetical protein EAY76_00970 [Alphaproteobacteria bacterium]TAF13433.1 MAG: hypothetical protein EAZ74_05730 [Alphaproteobacteria bacterium]TAF40778.1 MAG: hypothetical protein EAZ66_02565 [Alphaproteobacteria bacterium]TAF76954.1 MAG: hypothetical protein EAZ52_02210 [Alphaproteobacteria bacterium]